MSESKLPTLAQTLAQNLQKVKERTNASDTDGFQFLKLEKSGTWVFGSDDTEDTAENLWAIDPNTIMTGYIAWPEEGEPLGEEMASITDDPIIKGDLPDVGAKWSDQVGFLLRCIEGDAVGVQAQYKTTSLGGRKEFKKLLDAVLARATAGEDDLVPLVLLESEFYKHKKYGKVYTPILKVEEWTNHTELANLLADGDAEAAQEKLPEPEPEKEPEKEEPKKRSRRSRGK